MFIELTMEERVERLTAVGPNPTHVIVPLITWYADFYEVSREEAIDILKILLEMGEKKE